MEKAVRKSGISVSVLIATFNSARTLKKTLGSVKKQHFPKREIEILVIDGGSKDKTLEFAKKYKCRILENPMTDPLNAKYLGFINARGKYLLALDHDEVLKNKDSLKKRVGIFQKDKRVKAIHSSGYITPKGLSWINHYVNEFGDPFSFFMYRLTKDFRFFVNTLKDRYYVVHEDDNYILIKTSTTEGRVPLMELGAGGAMVDREYVLTKFKKFVQKKEIFFPHLHIHLLSKEPYIAVMKNDPLEHYSAESFKKYLKKLEWRIKNNIFFGETSGAAGFLKRERFENRSENPKKFFFIPYSFSLIFPLMDSIWLALTRKDAHYLIHLPLSLATSFLILYYYLIRFLGYIPLLTSYDGSRKILRKWR